jgi:hypothetical protein
MKKVSWADRVRNEVLLRIREERNILHTVKRRKTKWIGHILRGNCLVKHGTVGKVEGRIEVTGRRGRRRKELLDHLKEKSGYWKLKQEGLDLTLWRTVCVKRLWTCLKTDYRIHECTLVLSGGKSVDL